MSLHMYGEHLRFKRTVVVSTRLLPASLNVALQRASVKSNRPVLVLVSGQLSFTQSHRAAAPHPQIAFIQL